MAELKPCPFCGGAVRIIETTDDDGFSYYLVSRGLEDNRCRCRVFMESGLFHRTSSKSRKQIERKLLVDAWNRRSNDAEVH